MLVQRLVPLQATPEAEAARQAAEKTAAAGAAVAEAAEKKASHETINTLKASWDKMGKSNKDVEASMAFNVFFCGHSLSNGSIGFHRSHSMICLVFA